MIAIFKREFNAYFRTPAGYVFIGFFLLISGFFFSLRILLTGNPNFIDVLSNITFIFLIVVPILTMRLFSEDMKQRTDLILLTNPLRLSGIVLGKYFAALAVFLISLLITCIYPIMMSFFGTIAVWEIIGGYIGFILLGSTFIAVGLFISSLTRNQVIAAVITFGALLIMWIIEWIQQMLPKSAAAGIIFSLILVLVITVLIFLTTRSFAVSIPSLFILIGFVIVPALVRRTFFDGLIVRFFGWFSLLGRFKSFSMGILALAPIVYYLTFSSVFLFLTVRVIEKRRWA